MPENGEEIVELQFDPDRNKVSKLIEKLEEKIAGQNRAIKEIGRALQRAFAGINDPSRPLGIFMFLGPSGVGKTETAIALSEVLEEFRLEELRTKFKEEILKQIKKIREEKDRELKKILQELQDNRERFELGKILQSHFETLKESHDNKITRNQNELKKKTQFLEERLGKINEELESLPSLVRIDCSKMTEVHTVSSLVSSPPGYVGSESPGLLNPFQINNNPYLIILFDEFEKAHPAISETLLPAFDNGILQLSAPVRIRNGFTREILDEIDYVDFRQAIVIMTGNIGEKEMKELITGNDKIGFAPNNNKEAENLIEELSQNAYEICKKGFHERFSQPFINRIDIMVAFRYLNLENKQKVLDLDLNKLQDRITKNKGFLVKYDNGAKTFLLKKVDNFLEQMRGLKKIIAREVEKSLSEFINQNDIQPGDVIEVEVDAENDKLKFTRKRGGKHNVPIT